MAIVGILNITPDSFSDGRDYTKAQLHARILELIADGADCIDVGAESTAPNSSPITCEEEHRRLTDFFALVQEHQYPLAFSVDTTKSAIASLAIHAGVGMINDVSGGRADHAMMPLIAQTGVQYVLMYAKDPSGRANHDEILYPEGIVSHLIAYFEERIDQCTQA